MDNLITIFIGALLVQNIVLAGFLGICPLLGVSKKTSSAFGMGMAVIFVVMVSSALTWFIHYFILVPFGLVFMRTIVFILLIASLVQFVEMIIKKYLPPLYKSLGVFLPLITTNCAVLGAALLNIDQSLNFVQSMVNALGIASGFLVIIYIFATIRERLEVSNVSKGFAGVPISLVVVAIMAMAFVGFVGIGG